jgi:hypothetical protein
LLRKLITAAICSWLILASVWSQASADESISTSVTFSATEAGVFSVAMTATVASDPVTFGSVSVDADLTVPVTQDFVLNYTDTLSSRSAGIVTLSFTSFEPETPVPPFVGSDQVHFQIPNRYLVLTNVGPVSVSPESPPCTMGNITEYTGDEGQNFDVGLARQVSTVETGCGIGSATQPITLTLNVPGGVYPTTYVATVTIETTVE